MTLPVNGTFNEEYLNSCICDNSLVESGQFPLVSFSNNILQVDYLQQGGFEADTPKQVPGAHISG